MLLGSVGEVRGQPVRHSPAQLLSPLASPLASVGFRENGRWQPWGRLVGSVGSKDSVGFPSGILGFALCLRQQLSHDGLNPAHVPYLWMNKPTI